MILEKDVILEIGKISYFDYKEIEIDIKKVHAYFEFEDDDMVIRADEVFEFVCEDDSMEDVYDSIDFDNTSIHKIFILKDQPEDMGEWN